MPEEPPPLPVHCFVTVRFDQPRGAIHIARSQSVFERFFGESALFEPLAGASVQRDHLVGAESMPQSLLQKVAEQVVVTVPSSLLVKRHQEQVGLRDPLNGLLALGGGNPNH